MFNFIEASINMIYHQAKEENKKSKDRPKEIDNTLVGGEHSVMISENCSQAKGGIGSVIVFIERNGKGDIFNYKAIQIDGDQYKEDTWYQMIGGEIKEVKELKKYLLWWRRFL